MHFQDFGNGFLIFGNGFCIFGNRFSIFGNEFSIFGNEFSIFGNGFSIFGNAFPKFWKWIFNLMTNFNAFILNLSNEFLIKKLYFLIIFTFSLKTHGFSMDFVLNYYLKTLMTKQALDN
jgi:hypothetical protein